jgi:transcriptional regulator with XRE-family HTH domain
MSDPEREVGSILALARVRSIDGKRAREIAAFLKVSLSSVVHWETGTCLPPLHKSNEIARAYGLEEKEFAQKLECAWEEHRRLGTFRRDKKEEKRPKKLEEEMFSGEIVPVREGRLLNKRLDWNY